MAGYEQSMIAACGLDCAECDIRKIPFDDEAAERMLQWFKAEGWLEKTAGVTEVIAKGMYCQGCLGDREVHWDSGCWILTCCVDEHGLENCSQCEDFPCEGLTNWAAGNPGYKVALDRLHSMAGRRVD